MIPEKAGWHLAEGQLADYAHGRSTLARAASVETHLTVCAHCRSRLEGVLPDLPVERMWQHILSTTDPAPPGRSQQAARPTRMRPWTAFFLAPVFSPQRISVAVMTLLLCLTLVVHLASPRADRRSTGAMTAETATAQATAVPSSETLQKDVESTIRLPSNGAANRSITVVPPRSNRSGPSTLPPLLRSPGTAKYEPRDHIPWRSGCHPD